MKNSTKNKATIKDVMNESNTQLKQEKYNQYVKDITPTHNWFANVLKAYLIGGIICTIGQAFLNLYMSLGFNKDTAALYNVITLIVISIILTGLNWYSKLAKFGGAGTVVPITGFANSVASPAIEFKKEGQVFGIGCKIFTIAGPVILYGIFFSWLLGLIYYILMVTNVI
jgi:stage V sporulation protein AC